MKLEAGGKIERSGNNKKDMQPSERSFPHHGVSYHLGRRRRIHYKKEVDSIFQHGRKLFAFPYRAVYLVTPVQASEDAGWRMMPIVPKRLYKRAVARNAQKRRIREIFRIESAKCDSESIARLLRVDVVFIVASNEHVELERAHRAIRKILSNVYSRVGKECEGL